MKQQKTVKSILNIAHKHAQEQLAQGKTDNPYDPRMRGLYLSMTDIADEDASAALSGLDFS